jgi:hypothetical protein
VLNEDRGRQSAGFFDSTGDWLKRAVNPKEFLRDPDLRKFMNKAAKNTWALCAHTRQSTRGAVVTDNAHPFQYGPVVGSHNGTVPSAPNDYAVDSMWLFHKLSAAAPGDYQAALGDVYGWYALTWFDTRNSMLYLLNWEGSLAFNKVKGVVYYSSLASHLETATGHKATNELKSGEVWQFDGVQGKKLADFKGKEHVKTTYGYTGRSHSNWDDDGQYLGWQKGSKGSWYQEMTIKGRPVDLTYWLKEPPNNATFTGCWCIGPTGYIVGFFSDCKWRGLRNERGVLLEHRLAHEVQDAATQVISAKVRMALKLGKTPDPEVDHASVVAAITAAKRVHYDKVVPTVLPRCLVDRWGMLMDDVEEDDIVIEEPTVIEKSTEQQVVIDSEAVTPSQLKAYKEHQETFDAEQAKKEQEGMDKEDFAACNLITDPVVRERAKQRIRERSKLLGIGYSPDAADEILVRQNLV